MSEKATCHIGTSGWSYDDWDEKFYPSDIPKTKWFTHYATKFDTVEMNATFYRGFKEKTFNKWYNEAPDNFLYVFKANRVITHRKYLKHVSENVKRFCDSVNTMKEKLGLILLQLHPKTSYDLELLKDALVSFDDPSIVAVEFRDNQWFNGDVYGMLKETGTIFCNIDSPKHQINDVVTSDKAYFRYHGRADWYRYDYSEDELRDFAKDMSKAAQNGVKEIYAFFNNDVDAYAPHNALKLKEIIYKDYKYLEVV
jgi:uncharacterized protein YecE (DUF72 family)